MCKPPPPSSFSQPHPPSPSSSQPPPPSSSSSQPPPPSSFSSQPPLPSPVSSLCPASSSKNSKRLKLKECRKHRTQRVFMYESIVGKRVLNGKEEVKVRWTPCSKCGKEWDDTWEPAQQYSCSK
ncbi:uncharacterized protein AB9X84_005527 [Acanthopagrus schlegelii]